MVMTKLLNTKTQGSKKLGFLKKPNPVCFLGFGVLLDFLDKQEKNR